MQQESTQIKLTQYSKGAGCGCKIAPDTLEEILSGCSTETNPLLLVGNGHRDDAAVLDLEDGRVLISTIDFFTPIVDDAYEFGRIAAANALSDVYAMGGTPNMALAILGWPVDKLPVSEAKRVMDGASRTCAEAGVVLAGGHSIDIPEPVFGLSVNGLTSKDGFKTNRGGKPGDLLVLTKPIGTGILSTAMKRDLLSADHRMVLLDSMSKLNSIGSSLSSSPHVRAMTDVTGFGLLGHLLEMINDQEIHAQINVSKVPTLPGVQEYLGKGCYPDGAFRNWRGYNGLVEGCEGNDMLILSDPQTSGGLLIAVNEEGIVEIESLLKENGWCYQAIGHLYLPRLSNSFPISVIR